MDRAYKNKQALNKTNQQPVNDGRKLTLRRGHLMACTCIYILVNVEIWIKLILTGSLKWMVITLFPVLVF